MSYHFEFRPYRRPFRTPLVTHHGLWQVREGIILKLSDHQGRCGYGEIAPVPWFGSESWEQALHFCTQLPATLSDETLFSILPTLPACQFGFETVRANLARSLHHAELSPARYSTLLPSGETVLSAWPILWDWGYRTFKLKIGIAPVSEEIQAIEKLLHQVPPEAALRLDANGGLDELVARRWLDWSDSICERYRQSSQRSPQYPNQHPIEFIEQPLPPEQFSTLLKLNQRYQTPIALDESVATFEQLKAHYYKGWQGIYVIKAAIAGSPTRLKKFCVAHPIDFVMSSVFETAIGRQAVIDLALQLETLTAHPAPRALGMGTQQWFHQDGFYQSDWATLWEQL
ncbi:MAG: o-succinylbenzoate synthase [Cyanobacteria bacterium P01_D01_bin.44]